MQLVAQVELRFGGPGSGCTGPNCGRKSIGLQQSHPSNDPKYSGHYEIVDSDGKRVGTLLVHMEQKTLVVDYIYHKGEKMDVEMVRGLAKELKRLYPEAEKIAGDRMTGIRQRLAQQERRFGRWTTVPLHAAAELLRWMLS